MEEHKSRLVYTIYMLTFFLWGVLLFLIGFFPASYSIAEQENTVPIDRPTTLHGEKWVISKELLCLYATCHICFPVNLNNFPQIRASTFQLWIVRIISNWCAARWFSWWDHHAGCPRKGLHEAQFTRGYTHCDHAAAEEHHHRNAIKFHWHST